MLFYDYKSPPLRPKNIVVKLPMKLFSSWWLLSGLIWSRSALETSRKSAPGIEPRSRRCRASVPVLPGTPYAEGRLGLLSPGDKIRPGPRPLLSLASGGCKKTMWNKSRKMVFCYQTFSDLLWEKIVLVIERGFWNSRLKAQNLKIFETTRTIYSNSEWSQQFFGNRMLFNLFMEVSHI